MKIKIYDVVLLKNGEMRAVVEQDMRDNIFVMDDGSMYSEAGDRLHTDNSSLTDLDVEEIVGNELEISFREAQEDLEDLDFMYDRLLGRR